MVRREIWRPSQHQRWKPLHSVEEARKLKVCIEALVVGEESVIERLSAARFD